MGRYTSMVVVFLLALVLRTSPAKALDCMTVVSNILPCSNFLKNTKNALPEGSCCNAARKLIDLGDVDSLCQCLQPIASQFLQSKAQQIFDFCNLEADSYSLLVKCFLQPSSLPSLPPSDSAPPVPFVPLPLIPYGPLPPPISFYPPPEKNLQDGLLPPLPPLIPLPPLPPLIPLPPLPLPPLPFVPPVDKHI